MMVSPDDVLDGETQKQGAAWVQADPDPVGDTNHVLAVGNSG
jgi:hypothetical protein